MERGRHLLKVDQNAQTKRASVLDLAEAILSEQGEASGIALARELLDGFFELDDDGKTEFFVQLASRFGPDKTRLKRAASRYLGDPTDANAAELHEAAEPTRQELIRRLNRTQQGTSSLVSIRQDLLTKLSQQEGLKIVDRDFRHLFASWFNRGFLVLERIDWSSPAVILEKIIRYEAVHEIRGWNDLRRRVDVPDRRCYAFFHPAMVDEPLIFVEVALTQNIPDAIAPILAGNRDPISSDQADTAVFYSISNCQQGLKGVSFGNFLIKQVVEELARELPHLKTFVTLSPVPMFMKWLNRIAKNDHDHLLSKTEKAAIRQLGADDWHKDPDSAEQLKQAVLPLIAHYFLVEKSSSGEPTDPVARFHLGNGARLEQINWLGDLSAKGRSQSAGAMVNYLYDLSEIEKNHEAYANSREIIASENVRKLLNTHPHPKSLVPVDE